VSPRRRPGFGYIGIIIAMETATALPCRIGAVRLLRARRAGEAAFRTAKAHAIAGLTLGLLT